MGTKRTTLSNHPSTPVPGGTGMVASSNTFRPQLGRVIRDLFSLLRGTESPPTTIIQGKQQPPRVWL